MQKEIPTGRRHTHTERKKERDREREREREREWNMRGVWRVMPVHERQMIRIWWRIDTPASFPLYSMPLDFYSLSLLLLFSPDFLCYYYHLISCSLSRLLFCCLANQLGRWLFGRRSSGNPKRRQKEWKAERRKGAGKAGLKATGFSLVLFFCFFQKLFYSFIIFIIIIIFFVFVIFIFSAIS